MGERSNIIIENHNGQRVYLYGHWMGDESASVVSDVLDKGLRWDDSSYLTRMLFDRMTEGASDKETGFGISTFLCDWNYPSIVLNCETQLIHLENGEGKKMSNYASFHDYIQMLPHDTLDNLEAALKDIYWAKKTPIDIAVTN